MASTTTNSADASSDPRLAAQDMPQQAATRPPQDQLPSPSPVEMTRMERNSPPVEAHTTVHPLAPSDLLNVSPAVSAGPARTDTTATIKQTEQQPHHPAIGPSSDSPVVPAKDEGVGPTLLITLLLTSGARHPFKLDSRYLHKRNVEVPGNDPFNLSVYKLKELILREWREEWEAKPMSPSYIRLISFGKLLDDKAPLKDLKFNHESPNVLHMTIKPQDYVEEEDTKGSKSTYSNPRENEVRSPGCRCVIM